jgi:hypothetical protein
MPVITRNQMKNSSDIKSKSITIDSSYLLKKNEFIENIKQGLESLDAVKGTENKMNQAYEVFSIVRVEMPEMMKKDPDTWIKFVLVVYNKICVLEEPYKNGDYDVCNADTIIKTMNIFKEVKNLCVEPLKNIKYDIVFAMSNKAITSLAALRTARQRIYAEENVRKLRDNTRINYSNMGGNYIYIEVDDLVNVVNSESESKQLQQMMNQLYRIEKQDTDYVFEEDYDDDEIEFNKQEVDKEQVKEQVKQDLQKVNENIVMKIDEKVSLNIYARPKRIVKRVNYVEDNEEIIVNVCKAYFNRENGRTTVTHKWTKSNANEVGDSEYIPESDIEEEE